MHGPNRGDAHPAGVVVCVASATSARHLLALEEEFARLGGEGVVEVWDGVVVDWPPPLDTPLVRPLRNLPRVAPLPERVWRAVADRLGSGRGAGDGPLWPCTAHLERGSFATITVSGPADAARLGRAGRRCGLAVTSNVVGAARWAALRQQR